MMFNRDIGDELNLYFDIAHPIYDVLFDDPMYSDFNNAERIDRVTKIIQRDYNFKNKSPLEKLLIDVLEEIDKRLPAVNKKAFYDVLYKLHLEQIASIRQHGTSISNEELRRTEFRKGGYSMVLYVLLSDKTYSQEELDTYFIIGAFLQSADDFIDIQEDLDSEIDTMAIRRLIVPEDQWLIRDMFMGQLHSFVEKYQYDEDEVTDFQDVIDKILEISTGKYQEQMKAIPRSRR